MTQVRTILTGGRDRDRLPRGQLRDRAGSADGHHEHGSADRRRTQAEVDLISAWITAGALNN